MIHDTKAEAKKTFTYSIIIYTALILSGFVYPPIGPALLIATALPIAGILFSGMDWLIHGEHEMNTTTA